MAEQWKPGDVAALERERLAIVERRRHDWWECGDCQGTGWGLEGSVCQTCQGAGEYA